MFSQPVSSTAGPPNRQQPSSFSLGLDANEDQSMSEFTFFENDYEPGIAEGDTELAGTVLGSNETMFPNARDVEDNIPNLRYNTEEPGLQFGQELNRNNLDPEKMQSARAGRSCNAQSSAEFEYNPSATYQHPNHSQTYEEDQPAPSPLPTNHDPQSELIVNQVYNGGAIDCGFQHPILSSSVAGINESSAFNNNNHIVDGISSDYLMEYNRRSPNQPHPNEVETYSDLSGSGDPSRSAYLPASAFVGNDYVSKPIGNTAWSTLNMRNPDIGGYNGRANDVVQSMRTPHGSSTSDTFDGRLSSARSSIFLTAASSSEDVYTESMQSSVVTIRNRPRGLQAGDDSIRQDQQKPSRNQFLGLPIVVVGNCAPDLAERQPAHEVATHTFFEQDYEYPAVLNGQDTLHCETCNVDFHGKHRTGSWRRHNRLKHSGQTRTYPCSSINCELVFQRSDARLKHYRKYHLDLASSPEPRPREYAIQRRLERNENGGRNEHQTGVVPQEMDLDFNSVRMEIECSSAETDSNDAQFSRLGQAHDLLGINRCVTPATPSYAFQETSWQDPKRSSH